MMRERAIWALRFYANPQMAFCVWFPLCLADLMDIFFPFLGGFGWLLVYLPVMFLLVLAWDAVADWRRLRRWGMQLSDYPLRFTYGRRECMVINMSRTFPPRLLWVLLLSDNGFRLYMGWRVLSRREPVPDKVMQWGISHKRVA